jgi:hypothetical protein
MTLSACWSFAVGYWARSVAGAAAPGLVEGILLIAVSERPEQLTGLAAGGVVPVGIGPGYGGHQVGYRVG